MVSQSRMPPLGIVVCFSCVLLTYIVILCFMSSPLALWDLALFYATTLINLLTYSWSDNPQTEWLPRHLSMDRHKNDDHHQQKKTGILWTARKNASCLVSFVNKPQVERVHHYSTLKIIPWSPLLEPKWNILKVEDVNPNAHVNH